MELDVAPEFLRVLLDDLEFAGYVTARNGPSHGKNLYQISAKGIDWVNAGHSTPSIDSSRWTGRRSKTRLSGRQVDQLIEELGRVEERLTDLPITNSEKSQARAYLIAARLLAEAPDPPGELIWELIKRASEIATIAALFVAVFAILKVPG
jgi:DNA-binding PadR family transcriptional regulator